MDFKYASTKRTQCKSMNVLKVFSLYILDGAIYFVKGKGLGTDFGFPRVTERKKYRWKKMNFTTDLPKAKPLVTYVVASAIKSQSFE
jgi:hypothetical protein